VYMGEICFYLIYGVPEEPEDEQVPHAGSN
jgi:hypothetical protein